MDAKDERGTKLIIIFHHSHSQHFVFTLYRCKDPSMFASELCCCTSRFSPLCGFKSQKHFLIVWGDFVWHQSQSEYFHPSVFKCSFISRHSSITKKLSQLVCSCRNAAEVWMKFCPSATSGLQVSVMNVMSAELLH